MTPQRMSALPPEVMEKLGALAASADRGDEDRRDLKHAIDKLATNVHALELSFNAMTQTMASTSTMVATIMAQKIDERVTELNRRLGHYDRMFGGAGKVAWRLASALVSAAVAGGVGAKILTAMHIL